MNLKLKAVTAGVLFFMGSQIVMAQQDSTKTKDIEEVVVVGYQKKSKEEVSSAVTVVSGENLSKFNASTMGTNALQGKASGVDITAFNGKPGGGSTINIRGLGNVTASAGASSPLFVIDGFVVGNNESAQRIFNSINPNDYESLSVLKDAAAAAIYGSQGANGVIVLTTKSGKSGKPIITFKSSLGFSKKIDDINFEMMNAQERIDFNDKMADLGVTGYTKFTEDEVAYNLSQAHDWQKDILRNSFMESYLMGIRAGSDKVKYSLSMGYDSDNGIVRNIDAFKRYTGRVKLDATPTDKLSLGTSLGVNYNQSQDIRDRSNVQNPIRAMYAYLPYEPVFIDGEYNATSQGFPVLEGLINQPDYTKNIIIDGNIYLQYKILDGLTAKTQLGGYFNNVRETRITVKGSFLDRILKIGGSTSDFNSNRFKFTNTNTLNYVKSYGNHNFDLLGLVEYTSFKNDYFGGQGRKFSSPSLTELSNTSTPYSLVGYNQEFRTFSYGAFLTYDFAKKYIVTLSARQDADSRFGRENVFSDPFWSASLAWNATNEDFLKDNNALNELKLRASIGTRGYNNISLNLNNVLMAGGAYGPYSTIFSNANYGNPNLKWEVTKSINFGAEFGLLSNRVTGTLDYFIDQKKDFLLSVPNYSAEGGGYSTTINGGELVNKGLELSLNAKVIKTKDFKWDLRFNGTHMNYNLKKLRDGETERVMDDMNILKEGFTPWTFYLVRSAGINPDNGNEIYLDKNGEKTEVYSANYAVPLEGKSTLPKYYGGFGTTLNYKKFDASADFTFKTGMYSMNYMAYSLLDYTNVDANFRKDIANYWTAPGQKDVLPRPNNSNNAPQGNVGLKDTDRFLQDASYLRLRNVSLGYTFDKRDFQDLPINKIRVSLTGQNLATWTKFEGDPEISIGSGENQTGTGQTFISGAYSLFSYPNVKSYLFGVELEF